MLSFILAKSDLLRNKKMKLTDYYTPEKLTKHNYNVYTTRVEILNFIKDSSIFFKGRVLDLGCGNKPYENIITKAKEVSEYIGMDLEKSEIYGDVKKDMVWNGSQIPLADSSVQTILATELLEHCYDTNQVLNEINRVLSKDGFLIATVPFIWPLHETPHDFYRFTPFSLQKKLEACGFKEITVTAFGGNNKALSVAIAIWLNNYKGGRFKKRILRFFLLPIIKRLNKKDKINTNLIAENNIFIGLGITAKK